MPEHNQNKFDTIYVIAMTIFFIKKKKSKDTTLTTKTARARQV